MVAEADSQTDDYDTFVDPDQVTAEYDNTLEENDSLHLDMEKLTAQFHDWSGGASGGTTENAMNNFLGDRLTLKPGSNYLRYLDARSGATNPETESQGGINVKLNYRARYI